MDDLRYGAIPDGPRPGRGEAALRRLLRHSHIFSSAVREILEAKYLRDVSDQPLTQPQFHLLKLIAINGRHQVGEVAEFLGVSSPAVTRNIDKLERLGLVMREPSSDDRRATLVCASTLGRALVRRYEAHKTERLGPVLERFDDDEIEQLSDLLERFAVSLFDSEKSHDGEGFCLRCAAYVEPDCPIGHMVEHCPYERIRSRNRTARDARKKE